MTRCAVYVAMFCVILSVIMTGTRMITDLDTVISSLCRSKSAGCITTVLEVVLHHLSLSVLFASDPWMGMEDELFGFRVAIFVCGLMR